MRENNKKIIPHKQRSQMQNFIYQGQISSSYLLHGSGIVITDSNIIYIGHFKHDQFHGFGLLICDSLTLYSIKQPHNYNQVSFNNDNNIFLIYGQWKQNELNGNALIYSQKGILLGQFRNGLEHGKIFFYNQINAEWISYQFNKGFKIKTYQKTSKMLPKQLSESSQLYHLFKCFKNKQFRDICQLKKNNQLHVIQYGQIIYIGFVKRGKPSGLGIKLENNIIQQYGEYNNGQLNGYGFKKVGDFSFYQGFFQQNSFKGLGLFYYSTNNNYFIGVFDRNQCQKIMNQGNGNGKMMFLKLRQIQKKNHPKIIAKYIHLEKIIQKMINIVQKIFQISNAKQLYIKNTCDQKQQQYKKKLKSLNSILHVQLGQQKVNQEINKLNVMLNQPKINQTPIFKMNRGIIDTTLKYDIPNHHRHITFSKIDSKPRCFQFDLQQSPKQNKRIFKENNQDNYNDKINNSNDKRIKYENGDFEIAQQKSPIRCSSFIKYSQKKKYY